MAGDEDKPKPFDPELAAMVLGAVKAKARFVAILMALGVGGFVYVVADAGKPVWLVAVIGVFGAVLIGFFIALVWFWLRFFSGAAQNPSPLRGGAGVGVERPGAAARSDVSVDGLATPIPNPSPQGGRETARSGNRKSVQPKG